MWYIHVVELTQPLLGKKLRFILSDRFDFHMIKNQTIAVHAFASRILMSFSVHETLLPRQVNLFSSFRAPQFSVEMSPFLLKHIYFVLSAFTWRPMLSAACSRLCSRDSAKVDVFAKSSVICIVCVRNSFCGVSSAFRF